jgi:hypothetical protein
MITSWKRTIAVVGLALFLAATAVSFHATTSQAACVPSSTVVCGRPPIYR